MTAIIRVASALLITSALGCGGGGGDDNGNGNGNGDAGPGSDATTAVDAAIDAAALRCDNLTPLPVTPTTLSGFSGSEDFAFDGDGNLVSAFSGSLTRQGKTGGPSVIVSGFGDTAGTAFLPGGDIIIANVDLGAVERINPANGSRVPVKSNIAYPNGITIGQDGTIYVAEHDGMRVLAVDPDSGESTPIATGLVNPNGLSFSPDYQTLFVGSFGGGTVHRIESDGAGGWNEPVLHGEIQTGFEGGGLDGVAVDGCGNVYITEYIVGKIWRLPPEGGTAVEVASLPSSWIPNMHWGAGIGGWSKDVLYVMDRDEGRVFELDLGIVEKPIVFP